MLRVRPHAPRENGAPANRVAELEEPPARPLNLRATLQLDGENVYKAFRGRAYRVPPLPVTEGEKILEAWIETRQVLGDLDPDTMRPYFRAMRRLQRLIWRNVRVVGWHWKLLRAVGGLRNPWRRASEGEVLEWAAFLLARRTNVIAPASLAETSGAEGTL